MFSGITDYGRKLKIERLVDGQELIRHPDDLKAFNLPSEKKPEEKITITDNWKSLSYNSQDELKFDDWCNIMSALQ